VVHLLDRKLEDPIVIVDDMVGCVSHEFPGLKSLPGRAPQDELVVSIAGQRMKDAASIAM